MMRREALVLGDVADLHKQLNANPIDYSFGKAFNEAFKAEIKSAVTETEEEVYDDMTSPFPGLNIAPLGVVGQ